MLTVAKVYPILAKTSTLFIHSNCSYKHRLYYTKARRHCSKCYSKSCQNKPTFNAQELFLRTVIHIGSTQQIFTQNLAKTSTLVFSCIGTVPTIYITLQQTWIHPKSGQNKHTCNAQELFLQIINHKCTLQQVYPTLTKTSTLFRCGNCSYKPYYTKAHCSKCLPNVRQNKHSFNVEELSYKL